MQKKYLFFIIGISLIIALVAGCGGGGGISPSTCTDSDNGQNILVAGQVKVTSDGTTTTYNDACKTDTVVGEYYCVAGSYSAYNSSRCPVGYACQNGACVTTSPPPIQDSCTDSDGGIFTNVFGTISGVYWGAPFSVNDYCESSDIIAEGYCSNNAPNSQFVRCPLNQTCQGGVCG